LVALLNQAGSQDMLAVAAAEQEILAATAVALGGEDDVVGALAALRGTVQTPWAYSSRR
jgi:hypothetical protein